MWRIFQAVFITALFQVCISGHIIASTSSVAASWGLWLLSVCCSELDSLTRRSRWQVLELEYVGKSYAARIDFSFHRTDQLLSIYIYISLYIYRLGYVEIGQLRSWRSQF